MFRSIKDNKIKLSYQGNGFGLATSKMIVDKLNGNFDFISE